VTAQRTNTKKRRLPPGKTKRKALIETAIVDAYDESEQRTGFYTMVDEHLDTPFETEILGLPARPARSWRFPSSTCRARVLGRRGRHFASERAGYK
jgi:hypothetical protein